MDNQIIDLSQKYRKSQTKPNYDPNQIHIIQQNLLQMGFELNMINKVIANYPVQTTEEAVFLLMKTDGFWNHKFIPKKDIPEQKEIAEKLLSTAISKAREKSNQELCEICNELKGLHLDNRENPLLRKKSSIRMSIANDTELGIEDTSNIKIDYSKESIPKQPIIVNEEEEECDICMGKFDNPIQIHPCEHQFCLECFKGYINDKITNNNVENINCPKILCNNELQQEFFLSNLTDDMVLKYHAFKKKNEISQDPNKVFCPICDSYAQKKNNSEENDSTIKEVKYTLACINGHSFCCCGRTEHEGLCYKEGKEYNEYIRHEKIKKCPKCGFLINKNKGCNHMKCGNPQCHFEFCWLCMRESLPEHYNYGQCEGLQFIDEESCLFKLRKYPCLFKSLKCLYNLFNCLLFFTVALLLIAFPHPLIMIATYHAIIKNLDSMKLILEYEVHSPRCLNFLVWGLVNCMAIAYTPIYYLILGIGIGIGLFIMCISLVRTLLYCVCCCCLCPTNNTTNNNNNENNNGNNTNNVIENQPELREQLRGNDNGDVALNINPNS